MPTWDEIRGRVAKITQTINRKAEELSDTAALHIKISSKKSELEEEYHTMGRLAYESLQRPAATPETEAETDAGQIQECADRITQLLRDIAALQEKLDSRKKTTHESEATETATAGQEPAPSDAATPATDKETADSAEGEEDGTITACPCAHPCAYGESLAADEATAEEAKKDDTV